MPLSLNDLNKNSDEGFFKGWTDELRPEFETPEAPSCECQALKRGARPSDAALSVTFEELRYNLRVANDRIGKFGAETAERYDLDSEGRAATTARSIGACAGNPWPRRSRTETRLALALNPRLPWPFTPFPYRTGENITCLLEVIKSSASPRGCVVTCAPAFELGEMAASEIRLRCYPVRVIMQSPSGSLANPEFAGLLGEVLAKASTTTATLGFVWWYGTQQGAW